MIDLNDRPDKNTGVSRRPRHPCWRSSPASRWLQPPRFSGLTELAPWAATRHSAAESVDPAAPVAQGPSFADLIEKVQPAVVSVTVQLQPQTASLNSNGNGRNAGNGGGNGGASGRNGGAGGGNNNQGSPRDRFCGTQGQGQGPLAPPSSRPVTGEGAGFFGSLRWACYRDRQTTSSKTPSRSRSRWPTAHWKSTRWQGAVGTDQATDVAVLKVDVPNKTFIYVQFADQMPRVGDWVVAIGNPYGLGETATAGIVSALARDLGDRAYDGYLQIDAPINEGNSGGPTFDVHGNVVGINDAIFTPSGGSVGIGFDVPADTAKVVAAAIEKSGHVTRAWLGVQVQDVTQDIADGLGLKDPSGALVSEPEANSPAVQAGITAGDVIVAVNGTPIKDARGLAQSVAGITPGTAVSLSVVHSGQSRSVSVTLGEMPTTNQ